MRLTSTDTLGVVALPQETVDTTDGECETGLGRSAVGGIDVSLRPKAMEMEELVIWDEKSELKEMDGWRSEGDASRGGRTHDCADDLAPLALPPDLPPVILSDLGGLGEVGELDWGAGSCW